MKYIIESKIKERLHKENIQVSESFIKELDDSLDKILYDIIECYLGENVKNINSRVDWENVRNGICNYADDIKAGYIPEPPKVVVPMKARIKAQNIDSTIHTGRTRKGKFREPNNEPPETSNVIKWKNLM